VAKRSKQSSLPIDRLASNPTAKLNRAQIFAEVRAVYAELEARKPERNCQLRTGCCQFRLTGATPLVTRGEALVLAQGFKASGRKELPEKEDGSCPLLKADGKCMAYADRPFGCRTHFCEPAGGPYERRSVIDLIRRLEVLDPQAGGDGSHPLEYALSQAIPQLPGLKK
jgi:Fe-S-cluster containining protein